METTNLKSLRISAETLLEVLKRAAAHDIISCEGLSSGVTLLREGEFNHASVAVHPAMDGVVLLTVETENDVSLETIGGLKHIKYLPVMDVRLKGE